MDNKDLTILRMLQEGGRLRVSEIAAAVNLSVASAAKRIHALEASGVIQGYHASIDLQALGFGVQAIIQIQLVRQVKDVIQKFARHIQEIDEVQECFLVTGRFDCLLKVVCRDIGAFEKLITQKLSELKEIRQMQTFVILSKSKDSRRLPFEKEGEP